MDVRELVVASKNRKKLAEMQAMLADLPLRVRSIDEIAPDIASPAETGTTFAANSGIKALAFAAASGCLTLADDSGLEVDVLNGAPGVYSSSYGGVEGDDARNNRRLLEELRNVPAAQRGAQFHCFITLAVPGRIVLTTEGICRGVIVDRATGDGGFGYDPHFFYPQLGRTFAELTREEKSRVSHRGKALSRLKELLPSLLTQLAKAEAH